MNQSHDHDVAAEAADHPNHAAPEQAQDFSAAGWDARYSGERVWSGNPNHAVVAEVTGLAAGRALDVGCGEGADAIWLAQQGWRVTALDISRNAVQITLDAAEAAGVAVEGVVGAFVEVSLDGPFDLVNCQYPVLDKTAEHLVEKRLTELVAPGGTLLYVHHADMHEHAVAHGWKPDDFLFPEQIADFLATQDNWEVVTDERRERHVATGGGAGHSVDQVLVARRKA